MRSFSLGWHDAAPAHVHGAAEEARARARDDGANGEAGATCFIISEEKRLDVMLISAVDPPPQCSGNLVPHYTSDPARSCVHAHA